MNTETILFADDELTVRSYIRNILRKEGFDLLEATDGVEALQKVKERGTPVDLLLTDVRMPRMDGIALAQALVAMYPKLPIVYISGYPLDLGERQTNHPANACAFLSKPFTRKALLEAVQKCLAPWKNTAGFHG